MAKQDIHRHVDEAFPSHRSDIIAGLKATAGVSIGKATSGVEKGAVMVIEVDRRPRELTAEDRCDRCSARAVVETVMLGGGALLWCGHHFSAFEESLAGLGAQIVVDGR